MSLESIIENNDINATSVALAVNGDELEVMIHGSFWKLLFQSNDERKLEITDGNTVLSTRTFIRLAFKSFQLSLPVPWEKYSCKGGEIFRSHIAKIEAMKDWVDSPLDAYTVKTLKTKTVLKPKVAEILYCQTHSCGKRSNKTCPFMLCKACCIKKTNRRECKVHK